MTDSSSNGVASLRKRLDEPETAERIGRLLDRLDQIEGLLDRVEMLTAVLPGAIATAADTFDQVAARSQARGVDIDAHVSGAVELAERLTEPTTVGVLTKFVDRIDQIQLLLDLADQAPGILAAVVDTFDQVIRRAEDAGIDVDARIRSTYGLGEKLTSPETVDALGNVLDPGAVSVVGMLGQTLAKCRDECLSQPEPPSKGILDLYRMSRTDDGKRAIAFLVNFGRLWGSGIEDMHARHRAALAAEENNGRIEANHRETK